MSGDEEVLNHHTAKFAIADALDNRVPLDEAELDRLALLTSLEYGQIRKQVAKRLGLSVSWLDETIQQRQKMLCPAGPVGAGRPLELLSIVPADHPVNGQALLQKLIDILTEYVVLPSHASVAIALWIVRAHCDEAFSISPRLAILSPVKRCGKTTLLEVIGKLVPRPLPTSNVTPSVVYRAIEKLHPTLLIDEADSFMHDNEELRGILNSGHRRESAHVLRNVGDDHEPRMFSTWCPMVIAGIGSLPDTLQDRSIVISMQRKGPGQPVRRLRWNSRQGEALKANLETVGRALARWSFDHVRELAHIEPKIPDRIHDRAADNWSSLLTISESIGGVWSEQAQVAAVALSNGEVDTESRGVELLRDIESLFEVSGSDRYPSQALCDALALLEERPWSDYRRGKPISSTQLARLLRGFGIVSQNIRTGTGVVKGYFRDNFLDIFSRYLNSPSATRYTATSHAQSGDDPLFQSATEPGCSVSENGTNPAPQAACSAVALQNRDVSEEEIFFEDSHAS